MKNIKIIEKCFHCGAGMTPRWEILNSGLVHSLILAIQAVHRNGKNQFHYMNDLTLGHTAAANFQKLRFHGLIAHADEENPRNGEWLITKRGGQFLRGEIEIPKRVKIFRNHVIEHEEKEFLHIKQVRNLPPDFDPIYAYETPRTKSYTQPLFSGNML